MKINDDVIKVIIEQAKKDAPIESCGLTAEEEFDVYPYVEELTSRLIAGVQPAMLTPVGRYSTSFPRRISTVQPRH